jgi:hypothetical protein
MKIKSHVLAVAGYGDFLMLPQILMITKKSFADQSIADTYRRLRIMASAVLIGLPMLIVLSGYLSGGHKLQPSLSDYYFVVIDGGIPRTLFVIFLAVLGSILVAYRGLSDADDFIHNAAGFFAFGVAFFPMTCDKNVHAACVPGILPILHGPSAFLLFLAAFISVLFGGGPKLIQSLSRLPNPQKWLSKLNHIQWLSGILMVVGITTFLLHQRFPDFMPGAGWIFWIEYLGFFGFGLYWLRLFMLIGDANRSGLMMSTSTKSGRLEQPELMQAPEPWELIP